LIMALDEPTQGLLTAMSDGIPVDAPPLWEMPVEQARVIATGGRSMLGTGPEMDAVEDLTLNNLGRELAARSGAELVLVNYRKAPESPFPAAVEDAWTAVEWAGRRAALGARPLVVAGESAGANLAAGAVIRARDAGAPAIAGQVLVVPVVDSDTTRPSFSDPTNQTVLTAPMMKWFWSLYVPDESRRSDPRVAPLRTPSLAELPPTLVFTAEHDILRAEGEEYVSRLLDAGVDVEHRSLPGQMHTFFGLINVLPASLQTVDAIAAWVRATAD
jgi:acetyl esterase